MSINVRTAKVQAGDLSDGDPVFFSDGVFQGTVDGQPDVASSRVTFVLVMDGVRVTRTLRPSSWVRIGIER